MIKILLNGCSGKLATAISNLAKTTDEAEKYEIICGIDPDPKTHDFPVLTNIADFKANTDVVIDCSVAEAVPTLLDFCVKMQFPLVICTTGFNDTQMEHIKQASAKIPIFQSANMSMGINVLQNLAAQVAKILSDFDIEIIEKHHNQKIDAPSGTALLLAEAINASFDNKKEYLYDRSQQRNPRGKEIGLHSIRGGNITGEHSIVFAGAGETLELKHTAISKDVFAIGTLKAAEFIQKQPNGLYNMDNLNSKK